MAKKNTLSRRDFLRLSGGTVAAISLGSLPGLAGAKPSRQQLTIVYWSPNCDVECEEKDIPSRLEMYKSEVNPNASFELSGAPWGEYWTRLPIALAGGRGPDLFFFHNAWMLQFVDGGLVAAWPEERVGQLREELDGIDDSLIDGKLYAFDEGFETNVIYYGKKAWADAGLSEDEFPTTWDELTAVAQELTLKDGSGALTRAGFDANLRDGRWTWVALKYQMGEFLFSEDGRKIYIDTEDGRKAAQMMWDWEFGENPVGNIDLAPWVEDALPTEIAAMGFGFGWFANYWMNDYPDYEWGAFPLPALEGAPAISRRTGWTTMGVNPQSTEDVKDESFNYIQWHGTHPELMKTRALGGSVPALRSLQSDPDVLANPVVNAMLANMNRAVYYGVPPSGWEEGLAQISELMFVAQTATVDEALAEAQAAVDEVLQRADAVYWGYQERAFANADQMHEPEA